MEGEVRSLGVIPNHEDSIRRLVKKLGRVEQLRACYEAGPRGCVVYRQLTALSVQCEVVAPTLVRVKPGDRVRDGRTPRSWRGVIVPEILRQSGCGMRPTRRARSSTGKKRRRRTTLRARNRLSKFLLRHGWRRPAGMKSLDKKTQTWIRGVHFAQFAQEITLRIYSMKSITPLPI